MSTISANDVRELRERTGAGMMDCKKALVENNGDIESAVDWLRKKGLASASKKSGRTTSEGLIGVLSNQMQGALVEVNSETDFVSRNETFQQFVKTITELALSGASDLDALKNMPYPGTGRTVSEELTHLISIIGENMNLRRMASLSVTQGVVTSYLHAATTNMLGRIGVLVALESSGNVAELQEVGKQIAMHVAAANPQACYIEDLSPESIAREEAIYIEQAEGSGKPPEVVNKMVEGRLRKFYEAAVLNEQLFLIDDSKRTVKQVVEDLSKKLGTPVKLNGFIQFRLGEGIEKKTEDFASEVAAQLKQ
jgi:elongation factor Ts